tara:strand:+ start:296 stop:1054 length:759 start_codon:yes stop_codon:yes gene_type:complete
MRTVISNNNAFGINFIQSDSFDPNECRFSLAAVNRATRLTQEYTDDPQILEAVRRLLTPGDEIPLEELAADAALFRSETDSDFRLNYLFADLFEGFYFHLDLPRVAPVCREVLRRLNGFTPLTMNPTAAAFASRIGGGSQLIDLLTAEYAIDPAELMHHSEIDIEIDSHDIMKRPAIVYFGSQGFDLEEVADQPFWTTKRMIAELGASPYLKNSNPRLFSGIVEDIDIGTAFYHADQIVALPQDIREIPFSR